MQLLSSRSLASEVASPVIATLGLGRGTKATTERERSRSQRPETAAPPGGVRLGQEWREHCGEEPHLACGAEARILL